MNGTGVSGKMAKEKEKVTKNHIIGAYEDHYGNTYIGDWKEGKQDQWGNNKFQNIGVYTNSNDGKYEGEWKDGMKHG